MSRKDYVAIAAAIRTTKEDSAHILGSHSVLKSVTARIANTLADDNPRFDMDRFMGAAGFRVQA
jgi:hypothetical protein